MSVDPLAAAIAGTFAGLLTVAIVDAAAYLDGGDTLVAEVVAEQACKKRVEEEN